MFDLSDLRQEQLEGCFVCGNETSGFIKRRKCIDLLILSTSTLLPVVSRLFGELFNHPPVPECLKGVASHFHLLKKS